MPEDEGIRFADILTTASAVANYVGESDVAPAHIEAAVRLLRGQIRMEDLGRPTSPLVRRGAPPGATEEVRAVVQRWFAELAHDANAQLDENAVARFLADLESSSP